MNHRTSSKQRKRGNSSDKMKKWRRDRNSSTHSNTLACLPSIQQTGRTHPRHWTGPNHPVKNYQPPASAGPSHHHFGKARGPPGGPNRYPPSGNPSGGYYPDRGVKVEVTPADRIHHRGEHRHILEAVCLEEPLVVMELPLPPTPKVVNKQVLVLVEVRTQLAVIEVSSMGQQ